MEFKKVNGVFDKFNTKDTNFKVGREQSSLLSEKWCLRLFALLLPRDVTAVCRSVILPRTSTDVWGSVLPKCTGTLWDKCPTIRRSRSTPTSPSARSAI